MDSFSVGNPVMNLTEGIWWPCQLTKIDKRRSKPFTVSYFNENTVVQCRLREVCAWNEQIGLTSLEKLSRKRIRNCKILIEQYTADCEGARGLCTATRTNIGHHSESAECVSSSNTKMTTGSVEMPAENAEMTTDSAEMGTDSAEMTSDNAEMTADSAEITTDSAEMRTDSAEMTSDNAEMTADSAEITTDSAEMRTDSAEMTSDNAEMTADSAEITTDNAEMTADSAEITTDSAEMRTDSAEMTSDNAEMRTDSAEMTSDNAEMTADSAEITTDSAEMRTDSAEMTSDNAEMTADSAEITTDSAEMRTDSAEMTSDNAEMTADSAEIKTDSAEMRTDSAEMTSDSAEMTADSAEMTSDNAEMTADSAEITTDSAEMRTDSAEMTSDNAEMTADNSAEMTSDNAEMTAENAEITTDSAEMRTDSAEMRTDNAEMTAENAEITTDSAKMTSGCADTMSSIIEIGTDWFIPSSDLEENIDAPDALDILLSISQFDKELFNPDLDKNIEDVLDFSDLEAIESCQIVNGLNNGSKLRCLVRPDSDSENEHSDDNDENHNSDPEYKPSESEDSSECESTQKNEFGGMMEKEVTSTSKEIISAPRSIINKLADNLYPSTSTARIVTCHDGSHRHPSEESIIRDKKSPEIYIKKIEKSDKSLSGKKKKSDRIFNNYHCCFLCHHLVSNFRKHVYSHKDNEEVQNLMKLRDAIKCCADKESGSEKIRAHHCFMSLLRNKGDHQHNIQVQEAGGELLISRRKDHFDASSFGPCPLCLEWIKVESSANRHQRCCPVLGAKPKLTKGECIVRSAVLTGKIQPEASKTLVNLVYPIMTRDRETSIAQADALIVGLGNNWMRSTVGNRLKRKYYTSSHMRGAARLLIQIRSNAGESETMDFFLKPSCFDSIASAALQCCQQSLDNEEDLLHPSAALKMGYDLGHLANLKLSLAMKTGDKLKKEEATEFLSLMKLEWGTRVARLAHTILIERRMLKGVYIPIPGDLAKLSSHIKEKLREQNLDRDAASFVKFRKAVELVQTRLLVYNKRRSGELEAMTLANYHSRSQGLDPTDEALMTNDMSELEKYLLTSQHMIKIRGKVSRIVPVLVPDDTKSGLKFITDLDVRKACGIKETNEYVFANSGTAVFRAYDSLRTICSEVDLTCPERITSVNLRKYIATMSQVVDLRDHELQWLCNHLGHTIDVHKMHYRNTSGFIERVNIGKLMLMTELDVVSKFSGKRLTDISAEDLLGAVSAQASPERTSEDNEQEMMTDSSALGTDEFHGEAVPVCPTEQCSSASQDEPPSKKQKNTRKKWSDEEEKELRKLLPACFTEYRCPGVKECTQAISQSRRENGLIYVRNWETIKKKVSNMVIKAKAKA